MQVSNNGLELIKKYEGCRLTAYKCPSGVWTIGYGHTNGVREGMTITQAQADEFLKSDLANAEKYVGQYDKIYHFTQDQFDALVSFTYNCGAGNLKKLLNGGLNTLHQISESIPNFCRSKGVVLKGLVKRRTDEKALFDRGTVKLPIKEVAQGVIDGKYGNGNERRKNLEKLGYSYGEVQAEVNKILKMTKQKIISRAKAEIGTVESPATSNNVKYNTWFYGHEVSGDKYPWCAVFISWLFRDTDIVPKSASCANMLEWFEARSQIVKTPQSGDLVFFHFSTNQRRTNHVGLVVEVNGNEITTIEGNTSQTSNDNGGKVMKRTRSKNIVAYARPKYN